MRRSADVPLAHRQPGLCPLRNLALTLLVAPQNQCVLRRIQTEADEVPELGLKVRIPREFGGLLDMRLDVVAAPKGHEHGPPALLHEEPSTG